MKRIIFLFSIALLFIAVSCSPNDNYSNGNDDVDSLLSQPRSAVVMADMSSTKTNSRAYGDTYFLTIKDLDDYIPLLFKSTKGKIVSIKVEDALSFEHYIICNVRGVVKFDTNVDCDTIGDFISGNKIDLGFTQQYLYKTILIDLYTGQVVDMKDHRLRDWMKIGFDDDYIYMSTNRRILRISKKNLNSAQYITSDLEEADVCFIAGDYVFSDNKAYLKDDSGKPFIYDHWQYFCRDNLLSRKKNSKYYYVLNYEPIGYYYQTSKWDDSYANFLVKISTEKGSIGTILGRKKIDVEKLGISKTFEIRLDSEITNSLLANTHTVENGRSHVSNDAPLASTKYDLMYNSWVEYDIETGQGYFYYFIEDDSEFGCYFEKIEHDYSKLKDIQRIYGEADNLCYAVLSKQGPNLYFVDCNNHIINFNVITGEYTESSYVVDIQSLKNKFITVSGNNVIYKELVTGSSYVTKVLDLGDLNKEPMIVDYEPTSIINLPNLSF